MPTWMGHWLSRFDKVAYYLHMPPEKGRGHLWKISILLESLVAEPTVQGRRKESDRDDGYLKKHGRAQKNYIGLCERQMASD